MALDEARALLDRLGLTASYLVERYAAGAPQSIKNESVIRTWLIEQPSAALRSIAVGDVSRAYATSSDEHVAALGLNGVALAMEDSPGRGDPMPLPPLARRYFPDEIIRWRAPLGVRTYNACLSG